MWKIKLTATSIAMLLFFAPVQAQMCLPAECETQGDGDSLYKYCDFDYGNQVFEDFYSNPQTYVSSKTVSCNDVREGCKGVSVCDEILAPFFDYQKNPG